ncbi:hypothetical protein HPA02_34600 [Bisbaumannia pacifica]|uniref:Uncharacterized protein n=1 Tax=Bisbaumannia pacifica TaxID=77098 RepID=A0A510XEN2_9GAMM|nr:hypothetical protein [Halomonas pacifica]GEK49177.1 hypothetical protein HPA02_34600 [Halomonas pacifica]
MSAQADLTRMMIAGYHDDRQAFTRLLIETRAKRERCNEAWEAGMARRKSGVPCSCPRCSKED